MNFHCMASGFRQDMEELFERFLAVDKTKEPSDETTNEISLRFTRFSDVWRQMNFSLVFRYRMNENDLREFIEEIYLLVLPNVGSEYPYERRVSAIYLLYSLFTKQPKTMAQKIRMNFSYLEQIRKIIEISKSLEQLDVCYVWYKLLSLGAIDFVMVSRNMGPYFIRNNRVTSGTITRTDFLVDQFKTSTYMPFNELSQIHDKYCIVKNVLAADLSVIQKECHIIKDNIFEENKLRADLMLKSQAKVVVPPKTSMADRNGSNEFNETNEKIDSDIGCRRRQLKERALNCKTNTVSEKRSHSIDRRYGAMTELEMKSQNRKKAKGKRGRPKVAKLSAVL